MAVFYSPSGSFPIPRCVASLKRKVSSERVVHVVSATLRLPTLAGHD